jgi:hypothetical protein
MRRLAMFAFVVAFGVSFAGCKTVTKRVPRLVPAFNNVIVIKEISCGGDSNNQFASLLERVFRSHVSVAGIDVRASGADLADIRAEADMADAGISEGTGDSKLKSAGLFVKLKMDAPFVQQAPIYQTGGTTNAQGRTTPITYWAKVQVAISGALEVTEPNGTQKYYNFGPFQLEQTNSAAHSNPQYPDPSGLVAGCIENLGNEMGKAFYEYNDSYMVPFWSDEESDPM